MPKTQSEYKLNNQTILQEHIDENYEPTEEEICEYALYVGIDPDKESYLLWLAKEGLMKPLPSSWKPCQEENGELYYFNFDTGKSSWDHPYDDIYKARVIEEREKKLSLGNLYDTNPKVNVNNASTLSDVSSGKNSFLITNYNLPVTSKHDTMDNKYDSQYNNSDPDDIIEDEFMNSENDNAPSSDGFQEDINFGIDRQLSTRIERQENYPMLTPPGMGTGFYPMSSTETLDKKVEDNDRTKLANLAAQAAERRLITNKPTINDDTLVTPHSDIDLAKLRARLDKSADDEKLQLLEDNRMYIEKLKIELRLAKEQEERTLRDKMKSDLTLIENNIRTNIAQEKKLLESRQQTELTKIKQTIEREKQELQTKLRTNMLTDLNLEQQSNTNIQIRVLQMTHECDEKVRNVENRYRNEIEDLTRRYEQIKIDKDKLEKHLKEKTDFCSTLQRTMDHLRGDKASLERKLQDAETELKSLDDSNRLGQLPFSRQSSLNHTDDDSSNLEQTLSNNNNKNSFNNNNDDDEGLSDTDSDVIQMKQTLKELQESQFEHKSFFPISTISMNTIHEKPHPNNTTKSSHNNTSPVIQNISFERTLNQSLIDSGRWSNTMLSTIGNNTYPLSSVSKNNYWQSQPSLITREAVLKAARDVLPPGVIDRLSSTTHSKN